MAEVDSEHRRPALSLNAIARRLGVTTPALYTYFENKDAIYDALFRQGFEQFGAAMRSAMDQGGAAYERVRRAFATHMRFAQENPELYQLMVQRPVPGFVPSEESMDVSLGVLRESREWLQAVVEGAELTPQLPVARAGDLMIALMQGLTSLHLANNPELPVGEGRFGTLIDDAARLFFDAWQPD